jgi:hypothetical protein
MGSIRFCGATGETALGKAAIKPISGSAMRVKTAGDIVAPHFLMLSPVRLTGTGTASGDKFAVTCNSLVRLPKIGDGLVIPTDSRFIDLDGDERELKVPAGISLQEQGSR